MSVLTIIFYIILAMIIYAFRNELIAIAVFVGVCMGIGALAFWIIFDNADLGANIGFWFAVFYGLRIVMQVLGAQYANIFDFAYRLISFPFWLLNRIQLIMMEPWRYFTKDYVSASTRDAVRSWLYPIEVLLYILITPLRFVNAVYYNMVVYVISELYDLIMEVVHPSEEKEGEGSILLWIVMLPYRILKYPVFQGLLVVIEAVVWTVFDIFIPTVTMYHGTDLSAAQSIVGNDWLKGKTKSWTDGTFCSSRNGWAGAGAYFGSAISTAEAYAYDCHRLSDNNPVMIVCRVSLGKILNYRLAPSFIHDNTGPYGQHSIINDYAEKEGYTTGEWWNYSHNYWEYCMFDWKNRYNHPWRIRPIYVFNFRTGMAQHIDKGFRRWLFSSAVFDDIIESPKFIFLLMVSGAVLPLLALYGYVLLTNVFYWYFN